MAQARPESMFDPSIEDTSSAPRQHLYPDNAFEQQQAQHGTTELAETLSKLAIRATETGDVGTRRVEDEQQGIEEYFAQLQDIIGREEYTASTNVVHVAHASRKKYADVSHTEKISQTQVHVESGTKDHSTTHHLLQTSSLIKDTGPAFSVTDRISETQLQFGSVDVSSIPALDLSAWRIHDEEAAYKPPSPGAGGEHIATAANPIPDEVVAFSPLLPGAGGEQIAPWTRNVAPDVPAGAMENGAFHGDAIDSDLTYPVTPEGTVDDELELQRSIVLDAIQASYADPSFTDLGERDAAAALEGTTSLLVESGDSLLMTDVPSHVSYTVPGSAYPQGGNYLLTKDSTPFAGKDLADMARANLVAAEVDEEHQSHQQERLSLAEGDFALGGGDDLQRISGDRPSLFGSGPRQMVDLRHLDDHLAKEQESREIEQLLNEQGGVRSIDELLTERSKGHKTATAGAGEMSDDPGTGPGGVYLGGNHERPSLGALDDTKFAGAEETLPIEPTMSSAADLELHVGPSPEQGREIADTLEKAGIIPDVLDKFTSTTTMQILYKKGAPLKNGANLKENEVASQPEIFIEGTFVMPGNTYAVALVDVDAKRAVDGVRLERLLWLQIGIPGPEDIGATGMVARGTNLVAYEAPRDSMHRYVYVLFKHKNARFKVPADRQAFSCRLFAAVHNLIPIAAVNFTVENIAQ